MMKKFNRKKLTTLFLTAVLGCGALLGFGACGKKNAGNSDGTSVEEKPVNANPYATATNLVEDGCYYLGDFESYEQITQMKLGWSFGKVTPITKDEMPEMVTHGNQCIKAEVLGREELWGKRPPFLGFKTDGLYFQKYDFSDCESFLVDIYNAMDYNLTIQFFVNDSRYPDLHSGMFYRYSVELKTGWNNLEIPVDENLLSYAPAGVYQSVDSLGFIFDRGELHEETQTVYIDNFRAKLKTDA